tara:strand:- start:11486 stop:11932 length:447 start_codon:yes stop_codon:yes gene_type:complete
MISNEIKETYNSLEDKYLEISSKYLGLDEANLGEALLEHSSHFAYFASVQSYAKKIKDLKSLQLEGSEAIVMEKHRKTLLEKGTKATQGALAAYIQTVPDLIDMRVALLESENKYNLAKNIVDSLQHQQSMLVQISANKRAETKLHEL